MHHLSFFLGPGSIDESVSKLHIIVSIIDCKFVLGKFPKQHLAIELGQVYPPEKAKLLRSSSTCELMELCCRLEYGRVDNTRLTVDTVHSTLQDLGKF